MMTQIQLALKQRCIEDLTGNWNCSNLILHIDPWAQRPLFQQEFFYLPSVCTLTYTQHNLFQAITKHFSETKSRNEKEVLLKEYLSIPPRHINIIIYILLWEWPKEWKKTGLHYVRSCSDLPENKVWAHKNSKSYFQQSKEINIRNRGREFKEVWLRRQY